MSLSAIFGIAWVLAATVVAILPMRLQYWPGGILLLAAPLLLAFIGWQHGVWVVLLCVAAFASMFRNPLRYLWRKARGLPVQLPPEMERKKR